MISMRFVPSVVAVTSSLLVLGCGSGTSEDTGAGAADAPAGAEAEGPSPDEAALLDPNEASREQLVALPHFDTSLADALVAGRPYADMLEVDGVLAQRLSPEQREEVYGRLFKPLDLNAASGAEILLIPGVGERMEHEFEEYRPYRAMEEFRREIGKYVDEAEVRRLERYVTLR